MAVDSRSDTTLVMRFLDRLLISLGPTLGDDKNVVVYALGDPESLYSLRFELPWPALDVNVLTGDVEGFQVEFDPEGTEFFQGQVNSEGIIFDHYRGDECVDTAVIGLDDLEHLLELEPGALSDQVLGAEAAAAGAEYECDNCGRREGAGETKPARDLAQRLTPGGVYTDRECSACGALAYPVVDA